MQQLTDGLNLPAMHHYYTAEWLHGLDDQTIEQVVAAAADAPSPFSVIVLKRMGGATGRVPADATPFWYRDAAYNPDIHAQWAPGSPAGLHTAWARNARQAAQHASAGGGYVNFIGADHGSDRVRAAARYPCAAAPLSASTCGCRAETTLVTAPHRSSTAAA